MQNSTPKAISSLHNSTEKNIFDEGAPCLYFVGVKVTCIFSRGYLAYTRVPALCEADLFLIFITACFAELWERKLVKENFVMKDYKFQVRAFALYPFNTVWNKRYILKYDYENVRKILKHLHLNHKDIVSDAT